MIFVGASVALDEFKWSKNIQRFGFPFIGGALGAQNVCMGKYIAYAFSSMSNGSFTVRVDTLVSAVLLCISSIILHIIWLNKGLEKYDAYYCIIIYQTAWFIFTTVSGIVVYNDMSILTEIQQAIFVVGILTALYGVKRISELHKDTGNTTDEDEIDLDEA